MAKITVPSNLSNLESVKELQRFLSAFVNQLVSQFNGNIDFQKNIRASGPTDVVFANASDIQAVGHKLGRMPQGFLPIKQTAPASIYAPTGSAYAWTNETIYLQASAGVTATIFVI